MKLFKRKTLAEKIKEITDFLDEENIPYTFTDDMNTMKKTLEYNKEKFPKWYKKNKDQYPYYRILIKDDEDWILLAMFAKSKDKEITLVNGNKAGEPERNKLKVDEIKRRIKYCYKKQSRIYVKEPFIIVH